VAGGPLDLSAPGATVTIRSLFGEGGGAGEAVAGLPVTLLADPRNSARVGLFGTSPGSVPIAAVAIGARGGGRHTLRLEVSGATIAVPRQCPPATRLTTTLVIDDGLNPPTVVTTEQPWRCFGTGSKYMRAP
jgi:hypothetical protein